MRGSSKYSFFIVLMNVSKSSLVNSDWSVSDGGSTMVHDVANFGEAQAKGLIYDDASN